MENKTIHLSIVIPVYNSEKYIGTCLDSIVNQDFDNFKYEIICVNDGSKDSSLAILQKYASEYPTIKIIDKENGGVSSARNMGIESATGKWIWFIDSDDFIAKNCCSYLLSKVEEYNPDVLVFAGEQVQHYTEKVFDADNVVVSYAQSKSDVLSLCPKKGYANGPFYYFFSRDILLSSGLRFDETMKYAEDTKFVFEYKFHCSSGLLLDTCVYYYVQNPSSAMHVMNVEAHAYCMFKLAETYNSYMPDPKEDEQLYNRLLVARSRAIRNHLFDHCMYIRDYDRAKEALKTAKKIGWYPYKAKLGIYSKSLKGIFINIFNTMLGISWFYLLVCKIRSKKQNKKK